MAEAGTLHCPRCGGPATTDQLQCTYCHAQLATVACPACFAKIFVGYEFCPYCGGGVEHGKAEATAHACPRCIKTLVRQKLGEISVEECRSCGGLWVLPQDFQRVQNDRETHAAVLGAPAHAPPDATRTRAQVQYVPCPECKKLMNRFNFAHISGVIVDVCKDHGVWFDLDELRRIVEFIEAGGLSKLRQREMEELHEKQRALRQEELSRALAPPEVQSGGAYYGGNLASGRSGGILGSVVDLIFGSLFR